MAELIFNPFTCSLVFFSCFRYLLTLLLLTKCSSEEQRGSSKEMIERSLRTIQREKKKTAYVH